jgi:hypothetical protein
MKKLIVACVFLSLVALADNASADLVEWETGKAQLIQVGNWGYPGSPWDIVTFAAASGSLTLEFGTPMVVPVNSVTFEVGVNSDAVWTDTRVMTRDITVNGVTKSLSLSNPIDVVISFSDTLHVYEGPSVTFGNIRVTPLGWGTYALVNGGGLMTSLVPVSARFELVPAPAAVLLGLIGFVALRRKLRQHV